MRCALQIKIQRRSGLSVSRFGALLCFSRKGNYICQAAMASKRYIVLFMVEISASRLLRILLGSARHSFMCAVSCSVSITAFCFTLRSLISELPIRKSTVTSNISASFISVEISGSLSVFSYLKIACWDIFSISASFCCEMPFSCLNNLKFLTIRVSYHSFDSFIVADI